MTIQGKNITGTTTNLQIVLKTPQKLQLKSSHPNVWGCAEILLFEVFPA